MSRDEPWEDQRAQVEAWIDDDPDPSTADELRELVRLADEVPPGLEPGTAPDPEQEAVLRTARLARAELADRFSGLLQFGTAGLRGALGGGPHRMNRAVVIRAASGLADYLLGELDGLTPAPRVVVGYDARHNSRAFALDTASVLTAVGIEVLLLPRPLPTPVLAFSVLRFGADAGVMVTASHNPPQDNGYKVYLGGRVVTDGGQGAQIVPPADAAIAAEIARVPSVASVPRADAGAVRPGVGQVVDGHGEDRVSGGHAGQPLGLLLGVAVAQQRQDAADEGLPQRDGAERAALFDEDPGDLPQAQPGAAVLLGHGQPEDAGLGQVAVQDAVEAVRPGLDVEEPLRVAVAREHVARQVVDRDLFLGELEVHQFPSSSVGSDAEVAARKRGSVRFSS